ncbi:MAG: endolytic transglycosylase MltG, partial [Bacilli bacterium]|nr:endolytic transglycosylase MltG [Bacilli bacterium]
QPVDKKDDTSIEVVIPSGSSTRKIASILKENNLIKNEMYFSFYVRYNSKKSLKASTYKLSKSMNLDEIVKSLEKGSTYDPEALVLTFKEGERITSYAEVIAKNTDYDEEDVIELMQDKTYISTLIKDYWFLTDSILNTNIYYPLEGYLAPDTYFFKKDASIKDIIKRLLDEEEKRLEKFKSELTEANIHETLTMASIVELEGTNTENRKAIVGVFNNRLNIGMNLGSDVTTYYAVQKSMKTDLTAQEFSITNPYNTRGSNMGGKLPIGPICNPSDSSIEASINPDTNDYFYFVADKYGKIYFTKTMKEHEAKVAEIKQKGDWIW